MRVAAKWGAIVWSVFCLFGIITGLADVGQELDQPMTEIERAGAGVGIGCGMFIWVVAWAAVAGPALAVYSVSGKKSDTKQVVIHQQASFCSECGKYYEGQADFCPYCGKPTKTT